METIRVVRIVEGGDVVFVTTVLGIYEINVDSQRWKKLGKREDLDAVIPYMSFYNPQRTIAVSIYLFFCDLGNKMLINTPYRFVEQTKQ